MSARLCRSLVAGPVLLLFAALPGGAQGASARWTELNQKVVAAYQSGDYTHGVDLAERALALAKAELGETHPDTLTSLSNLALLYQSQGRDEEAERLFKRALELSSEHLGKTHPDTLIVLNNLGLLYENQGRYGEAEPLLKQAFEYSHENRGETHPDTLNYLNSLAALYESQGRYAEAAPLFEQAYALSLETLGANHPQTLAALNNLASLYQSQGRYAEAASLFEQAYALSLETLGANHPQTLAALNNLASLYQSQGRYGEAEPLFEQAHALSRDNFGDTHPYTLTLLNNKALLYTFQGRYGEAERLSERVLALRNETLGDNHPQSLNSLSNLALLYKSQGRYGEAEPLLERALELRRRTLGETHPDTLQSFNNLALLYTEQGRYRDGEPLFKHALARRRETFGRAHPDTLVTLNNLALLYLGKGDYAESERLFRQTLALRRETLGEFHPDTLSSLNNLAALSARQRRYSEAERLFEQALAGSEFALGMAHPDTLGLQMNATGNLAAQGRGAEAARLLAAMEGPLLTWLGAELYATESAAVARDLVASQRTFQDVALSLAVAFPQEPQAQQVAASALLRFKGLQAEEEAVIARLVRRGRDDEIGALAGEIRGLRARLAHAFHGGADPETVADLVRQLDARELALGRLSRDYRDQLKVREANLADLQGTLAGGATLLEFVRYQPADFLAGGFGPDRWGAVVVRGYDRVEAVDLGPVAGTEVWITALAAESDDADTAARALYDRLIAPLGLDAAGPVVIAPDDLLHLVPFHRLMPGDGRYWIEERTLRIVQTGRDLLRPPHDRPATGLLALGGIDFDGEPVRVAAADVAVPDTLASEIKRSRAAAAEAFRSGFAPLPGSKLEIDEVAALYRGGRPAEPVEVWRSGEASEDRLAAHAPPRVLHLATHGFYRSAVDAADRPMLLAGIALAGANRALVTEGVDGILYALEAQDLNLEGTELVILSACETAQGPLGHGEGVYGLVRALRTAGARNVLVTLRPIGDASAAEFMRTFYSRWLSQPPGRSDPATALDETRAHFIATNPNFDWTPFIMVGET